MKDPYINSYYAKDRSDWRRWLMANHGHAKNVWLVIYHKTSPKSSVSYEEAVEEALCFGWIDSQPNKRDDESYYQFFATRNPKSNWSRLNRERVENLINLGLMAEPGLEMVKTAKQTKTPQPSPTP